MKTQKMGLLYVVSKLLLTFIFIIPVINMTTMLSNAPYDVINNIISDTNFITDSSCSQDKITRFDVQKLPEVQQSISLEQKMYPGLRKCVTKDLYPTYEQRGNYWVLQNYITSSMRFKCDETITITTHGEYEFLHNLVPMAARWKGPISVAVYAPGSDFATALDTILHLRNCDSDDIRKYVTFHIFFDIDHFPEKIPRPEEISQLKTKCNTNLTHWVPKETYRHSERLFYSINLARNIARSNAVTFFNCPLDIELYPSRDIIREFFKMIQKPDASTTTNRRVYVVSAFEVNEEEQPPETKEELLVMLQEERANLFHENVCLNCHFIPNYDEWRFDEIKPGLSVFHIGKRRFPHDWEPCYIGTEDDPVFDDRLSWEGKFDKMPQAYSMCLLDYEFHTLDNAFLVHKPGVQEPDTKFKTDKVVVGQYNFVFNSITKEYQKLYGNRSECQVSKKHSSTRIL